MTPPASPPPQRSRRRRRRARRPSTTRSWRASWPAPTTSSSGWPTLTLTVSLEAIFLSTFVMIGQNRQASFQQAEANPSFVTRESVGDAPDGQHVRSPDSSR